MPRVAPSRRIEGRGTERSARRIAFSLRHEVELPHDLAGLGVERIHAPLHALEIAAGIADENQAVPCDRSGRGALALLRIPDRGCPDALARLEIVGEDTGVLGAAEKHAVQIRRAAIDLLGRGGNVILMRAPVLAARRSIDGEDIKRGHEDQRAVHLQQPGIEAGILPGIVSAENLELVSVCSVDLT